MSQPQDENYQDDPLSPEAMEIMAKARRRAGISMGIMLIGFMAVVLVIVYRLILSGPDAGARFALETIALPPGAQTVSAVAQDGIVTLVYTLDGETAIRIYDGASGELVREIAVVSE